MNDRCLLRVLDESRKVVREVNGYSYPDAIRSIAGYTFMDEDLRAGMVVQVVWIDGAGKETVEFEAVYAIAPGVRATGVTS